MKKIIKVVLTTLILSMSYNSYSSQEVTWSWSEVTQYTDSTIIAPGELTQYNLYCNGKEPKIILHPGTSYTYNPPIGATITCYVTAVSSNGLESEPSNSVTKVIVDTEPQPPKAPVLEGN